MLTRDVYRHLVTKRIIFQAGFPRIFLFSRDIARDYGVTLTPLTRPRSEVNTLN